MSLLKTVLGIRRVSTDVGDTIQAIALRELGDTSRWTDLVAFNDLLPPYLTDSLALAGPRVLLAGQQDIKIPSSAPPANGVTDADDVFGTDLSLAGGRLSATPGGDLQTISGVPNLSQALANVLATPMQDLAYHPGYGCDVFKLIGLGESTTRNHLAAAFVARAIRGDKRISRVENAVGTIAGDVISVTATAVAVDGTRLPAGLGPAAPGTLPGQ